MNDNQEAWVLSWVETAKQASPEFYRISLAVAGMECAYGTGPYCHYLNWHSHEYCPDERHQKPCWPNCRYRAFEHPDDSWDSFQYLLKKSKHYEVVRREIAKKRAEGLHGEALERAIIVKMAPIYCSTKDDADWVHTVLRVHEEVWDLLPGENGDESTAD